MQLGTLLPLGDIGGDPAIVREYAQAAEQVGYDFVEAPDHVLGATVGLGTLTSMARAPLASRRRPLRCSLLRRLRHGVRWGTACPPRPTAGVR